VLGASPRISVAIARSLHRRGIPVEAASFQPEEPDLESRAIGQFHRLPSNRRDPEGFRRTLMSLLREKQFDLVIPTGDPSLAAVSEHYAELSEIVQIGAPPPHVVKRVLDKSLTLEAAKRCGIRVPFSARISSFDDLESTAPQLSFPVVVKPEKKGAAAFRALYANNFAELHAALKRTRWDGVLLQEYCPGIGVGVELLIHKGECIAKFQHRRLKEAPVTGGVAILAVAEEIDTQLLESSMKLLRALEWEGVAMVEYKVDRSTGASVFMEVNGRFWGSVSFPIAAGIDFPLYYWQLLHGEKPEVPTTYRARMRWRWSPGYFDRMQSVLSRGVTAPGPKPSFIRELVSSTVVLSPFVKEALWSWDDPLPFLAEFGQMLSSFAGSFLKLAFRRIVPKKLQAYAGIYSRLEPQARSRYADYRLREAFGLQARNGTSPHKNRAARARTVLFVCYGNLMRSPMAEAMLKHELSVRGVRDVEVKSAGVHAVAGREAHPWALSVSRELGLPLDQHRAQPTTPDLIAGSDLIFAMDFENLAELETLYPQAKHRIFLLSKYAEGVQHNREIPDPYFGDIETTRRCYAVLRLCIENLAEELSAIPQQKEASVAT
jgi:protein-tyrosine-phosphatase/predicted ATP-grasp superfamily ATP-dependent carboligase